MNTYTEIAERTGTTIPAHLEAQATIPILTTGKPGRQGDVYIRPATLTPVAKATL